MGRGRAKAKQTKVARELKYRTFDPDLEALERELGARRGGGAGNGQERSEYDTSAESDSDDADDADGVSATDNDPSHRDAGGPD